MDIVNKFTSCFSYLLSVFVFSNFLDDNDHNNEAHDVVGSFSKASLSLTTDEEFVSSQTNSKVVCFFLMQVLVICCKISSNQKCC